MKKLSILTLLLATSLQMYAAKIKVVLPTKTTPGSVPIEPIAFLNKADLIAISSTLQPIIQNAINPLQDAIIQISSNIQNMKQGIIPTSQNQFMPIMPAFANVQPANPIVQSAIPIRLQNDLPVPEPLQPVVAPVAGQQIANIANSTMSQPTSTLAGSMGQQDQSVLPTSPGEIQPAPVRPGQTLMINNGMQPVPNLVISPNNPTASVSTSIPNPASANNPSGLPQNIIPVMPNNPVAPLPALPASIPNPASSNNPIMPMPVPITPVSLNNNAVAPVPTPVITTDASGMPIPAVAPTTTPITPITTN